MDISVEDDAALRMKVDEALIVYQEYVKNQGDSDGDKASKDDKAEEKA